MKGIFLILFLLGFSGKVLGQDTIEKETKIDEFIALEEEPSPINLSEIIRQISYPNTPKPSPEYFGKVSIRVLLNNQGNYLKHKVLKGHPEMVKSLEKNILKVKFTPAIYKGKPVKCCVTIPINICPYQ